jgi:hypothetical protein
MEARGNVVVTTTDGKHLETQQLVYDQIANRIRSDSAFVITEPTRRLDGASFSSDPKMETLSCVASPAHNCNYTGVAAKPDSGTVAPAPSSVYPRPPAIPPHVDTLPPGRGGGRP